MNEKRFFPKASELIYKKLLAKIFFRIEPEAIHESMVKFGEQLGKSKNIKKFFSTRLAIEDRSLRQTIVGIKFVNPVGLAAGFDFEARLSQILPSLGFGFETVGTITNFEYEGNTRPMLARLPKSKAIMVNKGFKNLGAKKTIEKLEKLSFKIPVGISIGRSNNPKCNTQEKSVSDIVKTFKLFEQSGVKSSYYELNISCPNLHGNITFYPPNELDILLSKIDKLRLKKPVFVKMPPEKSNEKVMEMLKIIEQHSPKGVIFTNITKDRSNKLLNRKELEGLPDGIGSFSGKPTEKRANELIKLAYKNFGKSLVVIGCGGVFSARDAYEKIKLGASLIQLITGMIYEGPQLISQINSELIDLIKKDGFKNISEAIGASVK